MKDIYYYKYIKYKIKYLDLCNNKTISGGSDNKTISNDNPDLYLFKAEWCGHCKNFISEWEKIKSDDQFKNKINFIMYDSEVHKDKINEWDIKGFPTLLFKKDNNAIEYTSNRTAKDIALFINENI